MFFKSLDVTLEPLLHFFPGFLAHKFLAQRTERSQEECQQSLTEVFCLRFHTCPVVTLKAAGLLVSWAFTVWLSFSLSRSFRFSSNFLRRARFLSSSSALCRTASLRFCSSSFLCCVETVNKGRGDTRTPLLQLGHHLLTWWRRLWRSLSCGARWSPWLPAAAAPSAASPFVKREPAPAAPAAPSAAAPFGGRETAELFPGLPASHPNGFLCCRGANCGGGCGLLGWFQISWGGLPVPPPAPDEGALGFAWKILSLSNYRDDLDERDRHSYVRIWKGGGGCQVTDILLEPVEFFFC